MSARPEVKQYNPRKRTVLLFGIQVRLYGDIGPSWEREEVTKWPPVKQERRQYRALDMQLRDRRFIQ